MKVDMKSNEDNLVLFFNLNLGDCFREKGTFEPIYLKIRPVHFHLSGWGERNGNAVNLVDGQLEFFSDSNLVESCPETTVIG